VCDNCFRKGEACEWGVRLSFRDENIQTMPQSHPSMRQGSASRRNDEIKVRTVRFDLLERKLKLRIQLSRSSTSPTR
jgi:hypothetical protein